MKQEFLIIHQALHQPEQFKHSVSVQGIHRMIHRDRKSRRYAFFTDYLGDGREYLLTAVGRWITVVNPMIVGYKCSYGTVRIRGKQQP